MSQRLAQGGRIDRSRSLRFTFNDRTYTGHAGDTLASALLANGVSMVARSWKYHRPRGLLGSGVEEPNALVQLFEGNRTVPNARMTEVELVDGLVARSVHAQPSLEFDVRAVNGWFSRLIPAGFYYKTFMYSQKWWHFFERHIRASSGLGESPTLPDPAHYDKQFIHADVLVVGGGVAGLAAALQAGRSGARVILCDEQAELGGWLLASDARFGGQPASDWVAAVRAELDRLPQVKVLTRTTAFGFHDHRFLTLVERRADHLPPEQQPVHRERLWRVRAREVILATGAHERPLVFAYNDVPGIMLASAVSTWIRRYGVLPGRQAVVTTTHDLAYDAARALHAAGAQVRVLDARPVVPAALLAQMQALGVSVTPNTVVVQADGRRQVVSVQAGTLAADGRSVSGVHTLPCDLVAMSGGFSPVIHLNCQAGSKPVWQDDPAGFIPGKPAQGERSAGSCAGLQGLRACLESGWQAAAGALQALGRTVPDGAMPAVDAEGFAPARPLWVVPHPRPVSRAPKQFVDFQNDVSAADIHLAVREGFESIEHIKRFTAMGFGTDQGKTGNINGMGIAAEVLGKSIPEVGTTTFRPNYTPVTFGVVAGKELGDAFDPVRTTPMHDWHVRHGAHFEDVGQWKRAWFYPRNGEDMQAAVAREVHAARNAVATLDASTLGKIDIQGPDAATFLNWLYTNAWSKLEVGRCRYGFMLDENGMIFDDGVTVRLGEQHYLMHTTSGGAARTLAWMEHWLQTEWPHFRVYLTSVTDHWSTTAVVGPRSRDVLRAVCTDIDFDDAAFPFMAMREGTVAGVPARVLRISFSGERSYEVNVMARDGLKVWEAIHAAGAPHGITAYGTETMHVLRAEKGYVIVGQDTDGSVTPVDLGMGGMVSKTKDFLGRRSLARSDTARADRKQWVGLLTEDPQEVLPEGAQILAGPLAAFPALTPMQGHVTSSYFSPTLGRSIAQGMVKGGLTRLGETVEVALRDGRVVRATLSNPVFYDPKGERQHA